MSELIVAAIDGPVLALRRPPGLAFARFARWRTAAGVGATIAGGDDEELWAITDDDDDSLAPGQALTPTEPRVVPLSPERLVALGLTLSPEDPPRVGEIGIKVVDVLAPIVADGLTWVLGGANVGRMQLLDELRLRCAQRGIAQTLVFPLPPSSAATLLDRPIDAEPRRAGVRSLWLISEHVDNPLLAEIDALGHTRLVCSPRPPARGYWPAIDPLASRSRALSDALVEPAHIQLAQAILDTLAWLERLRADPLFDQLAAARSFHAATLRTAELDLNLRLTLADEQRERLRIAERLERYLGQPLPGRHVPLPEALVGCREILAGRQPSAGYDHPPRPGS